MKIVTPQKNGSIKQKKLNLIKSTALPSAQSMQRVHAQGISLQTPTKIARSCSNESVKLSKNNSLSIDNSQQNSNILEPNNTPYKGNNDQRQIKSIQQLQPLYQQKIVSKSIYRFRKQENSNQKNSTGKDKAFTIGTKTYVDKVPSNILALQECLASKLSKKNSKGGGGSSNNYTVSKLIKNSIVHNQ